MTREEPRNDECCVSFQGKAPLVPPESPISDKIRIINLQVLWANDPYKALKTTLKAEIDEDARATLHSDI